MSDPFSDHLSCSILVTGGAGFLGHALVNEILDPQSPVRCTKLRILDHREPANKKDERIEFIRGDIRDPETVTKACAGMDAVIHAAAIVDWGTHPEEEVLDVNYNGTLHIIESCRRQGVKYLIYTSSLDAIYTGKEMREIDESVPYPSTHPNAYCRSKYLGETAVMAANDNVLMTSILRPSDIYGPGDPYHIGSLVDMARRGFYVRLGDGKARSQHVFVGNMAVAHLQLLRAMISGNRKVAGNVYFISDGPPTNFFHFFDRIVEGAGYRIWPENFWIPRRIAYAMGALAEFSAFLLRPLVRFNPKFSRFAVIYTCSDFTFKTSKAKDDFGFTPKYSHEEAFALSVRSLISGSGSESAIKQRDQ